MKDRSDDPSHHERTLLNTELHLAPWEVMPDLQNCYKLTVNCVYGYDL